MDKVWYYASESLFFTVWTNIIGNAVKYSKENSTIDITLEKSVDFIIVTVTDEGGHVPRNVRAYVRQILSG